jgi:uncharacterized protein (DUF1330 family)
MRCFDPVIASTSTLSSKTRKQAQQAGKFSLALSHSIRMRRAPVTYGEALKGRTNCAVTNSHTTARSLARKKRYDAKLPGRAGLYAQSVQTTGDTTMTVYLIADVKVTDDRWVPAYAASVHDIVHKHDGKYLSRSGNVKTLEGKPLDTTLIALLQFPSAEAAEVFVNDRHTLLTPRLVRPVAKAVQADRRHRSGGDNSLSAERMIRQAVRQLASRACAYDAKLPVGLREPTSTLSKG